jgi:hypothetical protein
LKPILTKRPARRSVFAPAANCTRTPAPDHGRLIGAGVGKVEPDLVELAALGGRQVERLWDS